MPRGLERWTIDAEAGTVERRTIDATPQEFPRVDERRFGQPYRYAYALGLPAKSDAVIGETFILKHDLETGGREVHDFGEGRFPGEFVFVPAGAKAAEDEGWLIGLVIDLPHETTDLVILDAQTFAGEPVASIRLPHRVPPGFHGNWIAR
jgi:carotenoid cleavage dioxygenase